MTPVDMAKYGLRDCLPKLFDGLTLPREFVVDRLPDPDPLVALSGELKVLLVERLVDVLVHPHGAPDSATPVVESLVEWFEDRSALASVEPRPHAGTVVGHTGNATAGGLTLGVTS